MLNINIYKIYPCKILDQSIQIVYVKKTENVFFYNFILYRNFLVKGKLLRHKKKLHPHI